MIQIQVKSRGESITRIKSVKKVFEEVVKENDTKQETERVSGGFLIKGKKRIEGIQVRIQYMARLLTCKGSSNDGCNSLRKKQ